MQPLYGLDNRGNTCWCAAACQALRGLRSAAKMGKPGTIFAKAMSPAGLDGMLVPHLFRWGRQCFKDGKSNGNLPADPAEFLVELQDRDDLDTACFESNRVECFTCQACGHARRKTTQEKMLILPTLLGGAASIRTAVDTAFGYTGPAEGSTENGPVETSAVGVSLTSPERRAVLGGAPPLSMSQYKQRFAGPVPAAAAPADERWWRCDDGNVTEVVLTTAVPYVLFYEERDTQPSGKGVSARAAEVQRPAQRAAQTLMLDCDGGRCGKTRQTHSVYVESYEIGDVLAIHVACPRRLHMGCVERTLHVECSGSPKAYDLKSFIASVGGCHYIAFVRKQ